MEVKWRNISALPLTSLLISNKICLGALQLIASMLLFGMKMKTKMNLNVSNARSTIVLTAEFFFTKVKHARNTKSAQESIKTMKLS